MLDKNSKIYVAGHHGLVGSAIWNNLQERGYKNLVGRTHKELDLLDPVAVRKFFDEEQPEAVVLAAAHVGGIMANLQYRADFIYQNLQIQQNVIGESFRGAGVYERAVCHSQDSGAEDVRELQPAVWHELHCGDAYQPVWAER